MDKIEIAKHLRKLSRGEVLPLDSSRGICNEISTRFFLPITSSVRIVWLIAEEWEGYSGDSHYPISYPGLTSVSAYGAIKEKWGKDLYGNSRRELCDFMATTLIKQSKLVR